MIDFSKLKMPARHEKKLYLYRCDRCSEETWYTIELPGHMLGHRPIVGRCRDKGKLMLVAIGWEHNDEESLAIRKKLRNEEPDG